MMNPDADNELFNLAADFIEKTNQPVFLTGKAGTGKTTFLKYIKSRQFKNTVVVAPTGVAAMNAGGVTIHSFFGLPFAPYIPVTMKGFSDNAGNMDKNALLSRLKINHDKKDLIRQLELLVIDEISMVRCDVLDAIDLVLRYVRNNFTRPFGGVQVLFIGDMYQLPPVIKREEWNILGQFYAGPYFFNSKICEEEKPVYIELQKIYRQTDEDFIYLLNQVRHNNLDKETFRLLNSRLSSTLNRDDNIITLTTHNLKADAINGNALSALPSVASVYKALVDGEFYENSFPAEVELKLKVGAQVMFLKNDTAKKYYNGKIGVVFALAGDTVTVRCTGDSGEEEIEVRRETWKTIRYSLSQQKNQVSEEEVGSFTQFPLRLAWAITIHKSQGLTFENVIIDAEQAFAPGQVYVALSRCTRLEGLYLKTPISQQGLSNDEQIVSFCSGQKKTVQYQNLLKQASIHAEQSLLTDYFSYDKAGNALEILLNFTREHFDTNAVVQWNDNMLEMKDSLVTVSEKFLAELERLYLPGIFPSEESTVQERLKKAAAWFEIKVQELLQAFSKCPAVSDNRATALSFLEKADVAWKAFRQKIHYSPVFKNNFSVNAWQEQKRIIDKAPLPVNVYNGRSAYVPENILHPGLYQLLKENRMALGDRENVPLYLICSSQSLEELANNLPTDKKSLLRISGLGPTRIKRFGQSFLDVIATYMQDHNIEPTGEWHAAAPAKKKPAKKNKPDTRALTLDLFKAGNDIAEIAKARNLAQSTIESHLAELVSSGKLNIADLLSSEKQEMIRGLLRSNENKPMSEWIYTVPGLSYGEVRMVLASLNTKEIAGK